MFLISSWVRSSIAESVPLISLETYTRAPSGAQAAARGFRSTRKFDTTRCRRASITEIELLVSAVTYTHCPLGLIATPFGSMPTMR